MAHALLTSRAIIGDIYHRLTAGDTSWVNRYAMRMDSKQETENYAWLGMVPTMREWIGERQAKGIREFTWNVTNKDYEATLEVKVPELRRDQSGQIRVRIGELARRVLAYPAKLITTLMINGESVTCYDGQYFFDTDHSEGDSGSQSNDLSIDISGLAVTNHGSTTAPSVGEMRECIMQAVQAILGFKDDQGEPMNEDARRFEVMVPTPLWSTAQAAVALPMVDSGEANVIPALNEVQITVVVNPRLTWTAQFAVYRTDGETKPFILQEEVPLAVKAVAEGSQLEFTDNKHWYGVEWGGAAAYGFWQHACLVTMT
ncbi:MAG: Mu-like prophage major head subunit gpT family protein [Rhodospirillaceae bacterium]